MSRELPRPRAGRTSLRFRVLLLVGVGTLLPAALVGGAAWSRLAELDGRLTRSALAEVAATADRLDEELTADLESLQRIASSLSTDREARDPGRGQDALGRAHLGLRFAGGIFLLDGRGALLAAEPHSAAAVAPPPDLPELQEVLATGKPRFSGLVRAGPGTRIYAMVSVMSWRGQVTGVVAGLLDPNLARQAGVLRHLSRDREGRADLVDVHGAVLASTERARIHGSTSCPPLAARLLGERRSFVGRCNGCHALPGTPELVAFAPLAAAPWGVSLVRPEAAVLATVGSIPWSFPVLALAGLLLAGGFALGAAHSVTRPMEVLSAEAERIAGGRLDQPIPDLGEDEVGRLGRSLDRMRASLADLIAQVGRANAELEGRVAERTSALHAALGELQAREEQRARLLRTVITAQEDERKRIARELHDETTQSLAVLVMGLESALAALRAGGPVPRLDEVKALAVHILDEVHRLILDLRPSVLDDLGLFSAVRWYAERNLQPRGISVRCEAGPGPRQRLPPELEIALFRICQEALNNVARHADADSVLVQMEASAGELRIEIEDDGRGFDPAGPTPDDRPHYGLLGIRERAEILGGSAAIESAAGKGTRVVVRVPMPAGLGSPAETPAPVDPGRRDRPPGPGDNGPGGASP